MCVCECVCVRVCVSVSVCVSVCVCVAFHWGVKPGNLIFRFFLFRKFNEHSVTNLCYLPNKLKKLESSHQRLMYNTTMYNTTIHTLKLKQGIIRLRLKLKATSTSCNRMCLAHPAHPAHLAHPAHPLRLPVTGNFT